MCNEFTSICIETACIETTLYRNDFVSKRLCIETTMNRDNNELVNQDARIVWAFLMSSLEVSRYDFLFHDCPLAGNTRRLLEILSIFYSVTSDVTVYNVGFLKPTAHDLSNSSQ